MYIEFLIIIYCMRPMGNSIILCNSVKRKHSIIKLDFLSTHKRDCSTTTSYLHFQQNGNGNKNGSDLRTKALAKMISSNEIFGQSSEFWSLAHICNHLEFHYANHF